MAIKQTSCVYLMDTASVLLMFRNRKKEDENEGKWIGIGGKREPEETIEDCALREVKEETGLSLSADCLHRCGTVHFCMEQQLTEVITVFSCDVDRFTPSACSEGTLQWIPKEKAYSLPMWQGDALFLKQVLEKNKKEFHLTLYYDAEQNLLNWKEGNV